MTVYIGLGNAPAVIADRTQTILQSAAQTFGGCSLTPVLGSWRSPAGDIVIEHSAQVVILGAPAEAVTAWALAVGRAFEQAAIMVDGEEIPCAA